MPKVNPIPDGYHTLTPHIIVKDGRKAIDFYKKAFGAEERFAMPGPDGKTIVHAEIKIGDSLMMLGSENPKMNSRSPGTLGGSPVVLSLYVPDCDQVFQRAVTAGAKALMPPTDMFWGDRFSMVADPEGHSWAIATHIKEPTPEELAKGMQTPC